MRVHGWHEIFCCEYTILVAVSVICGVTGAVGREAAYNEILIWDQCQWKYMIFDQGNTGITGDHYQLIPVLSEGLLFLTLFTVFMSSMYMRKL